MTAVLFDGGLLPVNVSKSRPFAKTTQKVSDRYGEGSVS